jgi:integrase
MAKVLTAAAVERLKPGAKRIELSDAGAPGLFLIIQPSGSKSWAMRFRRTGERAAKLTLGPVDLSGREAPGEPTLGTPLSLAAARRLAAEIQRQRALGRDVVADYAAEKHRRLSAAESTFGIAVRRFIDEHARPKTRRWKETARVLGLRPDDLSNIRGGLADRWRDRPVTEITAGDIHAVVEESRRRGIPGLARRAKVVSEARARGMLAALSPLFDWLHRGRVVGANPCHGVHRPSAPSARDRVLSDHEVRLFWSACEEVGHPFEPLLKLLLITGARREEAARMTAEELSDDREMWTLPPSRTKNKREHRVPLPPLARELIGSSPTSGFLFTTTRGKTPVSGFSKIKSRLDARMRAASSKKAIPLWRIHDLRRTAATGMARAGADLQVIERALNHVSGSYGGIVGVYQKHRYDDEVRAALAGWASLLRGIVENAGSSNVVPLRMRPLT